MEFWEKLSKELTQKDFSAQQIKKLEELFRNIDATAILNMPQDELLPAMTGRNVADKREKIETLLAVVREVKEQMEGGQPSPSRREFTILGQIRATDGQPLAKVTVRAYERGIGRENALGDTVTDAAGNYQISIPPEKLVTLERERPHLMVRVYSERNTMLGTSEIIFNATSGRTIDLTVEPFEEALISTFETVTAKLKPLLGRQQLAGLTEGDTRILAIDARIEPKQVEWLRQSALLSRETGLPADILYALASQRIPLETEKLLTQSDEKLQAALEVALSQNVIPAAPDGFMDIFLARFRELRVEHGLLLQHEITGQLQNQETGEALVGFPLRIVDLDARQRGPGPGMTRTDQTGEFSIIYTAPPRTQARRSFRLHILDREGKDLHTTEVKALPGQAKLDDPVKIQLPFIERRSPAIIELASALNMNLSPELSSALERHKITTLDDVRRTGGLDRLNDNALGLNDPVVRRLQVHAELRILSEDIKVNEALIDKGYDSIFAVSRKSRGEFTRDVRALTGEEHAIRLYGIAKRQTLFLDNLATKHRIDQANGLSNNSAIINQQPDTYLPCNCRECESAVSPQAYLTDLLDYTVRHVKNDDNSIGLSFLESSFHQPFGNLPVSCASEEESVRQVRLAVEVLRSILDETSLEPGTIQKLLGANRDYCMAAYESMLLQIGTSYDELRLVRLGSQDERNALADRMAISQSGNVAPHQLINQLWLDQEKQYPDPDALNEVNLGRLFGLPSTYVQSRFSKGTKLGDEQSQINAWQLDGLAWLRNTDENGRVHLRLTKSGNTVLIRLYRDQARQESTLVASGSRMGNNGPVSLAEENLSGISGTLTVQYKTATNNISIVVFPFFLSWRLAHLRQQWLSSKKPQHDSPFGSPPVIDPDLVGPDDLRHPEQGNPAFDIWVERRGWVDARINELRLQTMIAADGQTVPDFRKMLDVMEANGWPATTLADLEELEDLIQQAPDLDAVTSKLGSLYLVKEGFERMMDIKAKADRWENNTGEAVTDDEWEEFRSILVQSLKQARRSAWRTEEQGVSGTLRSLEYFWPAMREAVEGQWPPLPLNGQPWIDPDTVKEGDLPDSAAGDQARTFLHERHAELMAVKAQLQATRESNGLEALLVQALGAAPTPSAWDDELNRLQQDLLSSDAATAETAREQIASDLRMSETEFGLLMTLKAGYTAGQTDIEQTPKLEDWAMIYTLLTRVKKERVKFPQWIAAETSLAYWNFRKARLPRWRATAQARQIWNEALHATAKLPVIDPDLVDIPDFITPFPSDKAFGLWQERESELDTLKQTITNVTAADNIEKTDLMLTNHLGVNADQLEALVEAANNGNLSTARLQQLTLSRAEMDFLLRIRALVSDDMAGPAAIDEEMNDFCDIMVQVEKRRKLFPKWRSEELNLDLVLSPEHFKLRMPESLTMPPSPPEKFDTWRAKAIDRRDWEKTLKVRMEQKDNLTQSLRSAVSATKETTLPDLRNDLIRVLNAQDKSMEVTAEEMSERLLIDMTNSGCKMTTRTSQAIVTLQLLLWSLRTGRLKAAWPALSLDADEFDEEWKWLGTYATWRAAMMVFLYPENILLPKLRRHQTPVFRYLAGRFQLAARVTPADACEAANAYTSYFRDVCNLNLEASCWALSRMPGNVQGCATIGEDERNRLYMFARSNVSKKVYWSVYDPEAPPDYPQTFWLEIPLAENETPNKLIGAVTYQYSEDVFICLYVITRAGDKQKIVACKLNLSGNKSGKWDDEQIEVPLSEEIENFTATIFHSPHDRSFDAPGIDLPDVYVVSEDKIEHEGNLYPVSKLYRYKLDIEQNLIVEQTGGTNLNPKYEGDYKILFTGYYRNNQNLFKHKLIYLSENSEPIPHTLLRSTWATLPDKNILSLAGFGGAFTWPDTEGVYVFIQGSFGKSYSYLWPRPFNPSNQDYGSDSVAKSLFTSSHWTFRFRIIPVNGSNDNNSVIVGNQRSSSISSDASQGLFISRIVRESAHNVQLSVDSSIRIAPKLRKAQPLEQVTVAGTEIVPGNIQNSLVTKAQRITSATNLSAVDGSATVATYLEEAYCFVPLLIAQELQKSGEWQAALDWYRSLYDYTAPENERWIIKGLKLSGAELNFEREENWIRDPLDPHAIAATRTGSFERGILQSIIRCLLDFADAEFTQDTTESNARARRLYIQALKLLDVPELKQEPGECEETIGKIVVQIAKFPQLQVESFEIGQILASLDPGSLSLTEVRVNSIMETRDPQEKKAEAVRKVLDQIKFMSTGRTSFAETLDRSYKVTVREHRKLLALTEVRDYADSIAAFHITEGSVYFPAFFWGNRSFSFCIPPNPILKALRFHTELNLYKLRTCRNIAGMERELEPYSAPTDPGSGLPSIGAGGQISLPGAFSIRPTQYRYKVLVDRARQMVDIAQQMEATFLSFLEKGDAERYSLLKARQNARLARSGLRLQDLRVQEAHQGKTLAQLQKEVSEIQDEHYSDLIAAGSLAEEVWALNLLWASMAFQFGVAAVRGFALIGAGLTADISAGGATFGTGSLAGAIGSAALDAQIYSAISGGFGKWSSALSMAASQKRKKEDWKLQLSLAKQNRQIGQQQIFLAESRKLIVGQEHEISRIQADHADDVLEFLSAKKFTSADLYDWMSGVMEGVYSYFLQQATGMARLAENQLSFERQEMSPAFIQADYWHALGDKDSITNNNADVPDRRGLTGSARLLQDITRLDQHAFETDKRKLQLTRTISVARLDPLAFQQFRETGVMVFATPMKLFDHDFPGHYLRLIKRVRTSVIALIPPLEGIKATLATTGISRAVIGGNLFQTTVVNRGPESVALTSPQNATGLFELEAQGQSEMLLPFEGLGVDTTWEFRLPKPANAFDYRTIADVLFTIEYTALDSPTYRQQVIQQLDRSLSVDRPFSFRHQFADAWYDLHHPGLVQDPQLPMVVTFATQPEDFPPNVSNFNIEHITVYIARKSEITNEVNLDLKFTMQGGSGSIGGSSGTVDGVVSTRMAGAGSWMPMIGKSPVGEWTLAIEDNQENRKLFEDGLIEDILFVITFGAETEAWPG